MAHDVFISYASSDKAIADAVCAQLESIHRIRCWIAPRDVTPGSSWAGSIIDALDQSKIMVLIFSSNANASVQIEREVERAVHKGINIIPLRVENTVPTKTLEYFISAPHWLDALSAPREQHIQKLAVAVKALLAKPVHGAPSPSPVEHLDVVGHEMPAPPVAVTNATQSPPVSKWAVMAAAVVVVVAVAAYGLRSGSTEPPISGGAPAQAPAASPTSPVAGVAGGIPAPAEVRAPSSAPSAPAPAVAGQASPSPSPDRAAPASAAVARPPAGRTGAPGGAPAANLLIDFRNTEDEGRIALAVDGQEVWAELLGEGIRVPASGSASPSASIKPGIPEGPVSAALTVRQPAKQATVTLLNRDGKLEDVKSIALKPDDLATPRTLQIRFSRFRKDIELALVDPPATATSAAPGTGPASPGTVTPAGGGSAAPAKPASGAR